MRTVLLGSIGLLVTYFVSAQRDCRSFEYQQQLIQKDPGLQTSHNAAQNFVLLMSHPGFHPMWLERTITIPVVVHVLYHYPAENIS